MDKTPADPKAPGGGVIGAQSHNTKICSGFLRTYSHILTIPVMRTEITFPFN